MKYENIEISFLITHFNRSSDLIQCIDAIQNLGLDYYEIVVSDDASEPKHIQVIENLAIDKLILSDTNQGLAANINKGLKNCEGTFLVYCQEDFTLKPELVKILEECKTKLKEGQVDLIRFVSNVHFKKKMPLSDSISLIPKFSFSNFLTNYYQYSDHPFITQFEFYSSYGTYLEKSSGRYGETEYAIRILKSQAKMGITNQVFAETIIGSSSVLINEGSNQTPKIKWSKSFVKIARAFRLYFEYLIYNKNKRGLFTYKNFRK